MSFATRCTACGTIFRVVQDQLRVSEGWVRCGRCAEVFDAREQLFDIDRDAPPVWAGDAAGSTSVPVAQGQDLEAQFDLPAVVAGEPPETPSPAPQPVAAAGMVSNVDAPVRQEPQWVGEAAHSAEESWGKATEAALGFKSPGTGVSPPTAPPVTESHAAPLVTAEDRRTELPSFMRPASAASRWQGSGARLAMAGSTLLLLVALMLQLLLHFRDAVAAVYPQALPSLQALCQKSGCNVRAWRRIEALNVENSALTQAVGERGGAMNNHYQLTLSLRNKSGVPVAMPSIELSLLDASGAVVLRRVLNATDFGQDHGHSASPTEIAPGSDIPLQMRLTTGFQRISGYSVEIFHP